MSGYSFRGYTPFSHLSNISRYLQSNTTPLERDVYNNNPQVGYQRYMDMFRGMPTSQQQTMQSLYDQVLRQWSANQAHNFGRQNPIDWLSYLANHVNWQQQFGRLTPQQRHEDPSAFMRPVRVLNFL